MIFKFQMKIKTLISIYNAECTNNELKNLSSLASYVEYTYNYNDSTGFFDVTLNNVPKELYLVYNDNRYNSENNVVIISGINPGDEVKLKVYSSEEAECITEYLRVISFKLPFLNKYYNSKECELYRELDVCSNKFTTYDISNKSFQEMINQAQNDKEKPNYVVPEKVEEIKKESMWEDVKKYFNIIWVPCLLVISSSFLTFIICNFIYKKLKHGL